MKARRICLGPALAAFVSTLPLCAAAEMNQAVMMKWASVQVIHYLVIGNYEGVDMVVNAGTNGYADVTDHVEIEFDFDQTTAQLVGIPTVRDFPTSMGELRNGAEGCRAPTLSGSYERSSIDSLRQGMAGQLAMMVRTDYPSAQMPVACTGGNVAVAAHSTSEQEDFMVPGVMMLAMADEFGDEGGDVQITKDASSFILKRGDWTYVYTPTPVR